MQDGKVKGFIADHCRIGSLEMTIAAGLVYYYDHCRIGSLEIQQPT